MKTERDLELERSAPKTTKSALNSYEDAEEDVGEEATHRAKLSRDREAPRRETESERERKSARDARSSRKVHYATHAIDDLKRSNSDQ